MKNLINIIAYITMIAGGSGMLGSVGFLYSNKVEYLIGAGAAFIAGAILFGSGLLTLAMFNKKD